MRSRADAVPAFIWVPEVPDPDATLALDEPTAHHVRRVCRARPGDSLTLTDGRGVRAHATLDADGRVHVTDRQSEPALRPSMLVCGAPEGDRADWLIEKLAELGMGVFQPIDTGRARWRPERSRHERWGRLARAALNQSRGAWLMEIRPVLGWDEFLGATSPGADAWFADPDGIPGPPVRNGSSSPWVGVVGPAAGFDEREKSALVARGFQAISLSVRRLRTETAAIALSAQWAWAMAGGISRKEPAPPS